MSLCVSLDRTLTQNPGPDIEQIVEQAGYQINSKSSQNMWHKMDVLSYFAEYYSSTCQCLVELFLNCHFR